jgi:hypothetical protein
MILGIHPDATSVLYTSSGKFDYKIFLVITYPIVAILPTPFLLNYWCVHTFEPHKFDSYFRVSGGVALVSSTTFLSGVLLMTPYDR